jgi:hypothetical protein
MPVEINVFADEAKARNKRDAHKELKRAATLETIKALAIYDHRTDDEGENLLLDDRTVYVVTARW